MGKKGEPSASPGVSGPLWGEHPIRRSGPITFFNYTDEAGIQHVVWFEDARSVQAKYLLVNQDGLRGVSYWVLGLPFPQNWAVLENMFNIVKVAG